MQADEQITNPNFIFWLIGILLILGGLIEGFSSRRDHHDN